MLNEFLALADGWISERTDERGAAWFRGAINEVTKSSNERPLSVAIGMAPRRLGKADSLSVSNMEAELKCLDFAETADSVTIGIPATGRTRVEQMSSAVHPRTDIRQCYLAGALSFSPLLNNRHYTQPRHPDFAG